MSTVFAALALLIAPQGTPPDGKVAFEKMLTKYYEAKTVKGTIEFNQTVEGVGKSTILTTLQTQKPNLLFIEQIKTTGDRKTFRAVSDGKLLGFNAPEIWKNYDPAARMVFTEAPESIKDASDAFSVLMLDRQLATSLAIYNPYDVVTFTKPIRNIKFQDEVTANGVPAWRFVADYGIGVGGPGSPGAAAFTKAWFYLSKEYDFLGMVFEEIIQGQDKRTRRTVSYKVTNQWIVRVVVDAPVDTALFRVR